VETCPAKARIFGNLLDPNDEIAKLLARNPFQVIKSEMGTYPKVFYIGADADAMDPFAGREEWT